MGFKADDLVNDIKQLIVVPSSDPLFGTAGLLRFLNTAFSMEVVPLINRIRESYYLTHQDFDISTLTPQEGLEIPTRSVAKTVNYVAFVQNVGQESETLIPVPQVSVSQLYTNWFPATPSFYFKGNKIYLTPNTYQTLRVFYIRRPNELVYETSAVQVESVAGNVITTTGALDIPSSFVAGVTLDGQSEIPSYDLTGEDMEITLVAGANITVDDAQDVAAGDWLALNGQALYPQIPQEGINLLTHLAALYCLRALPDTDAYKNFKTYVEELSEKTMALLTPRAQTQYPSIQGGVFNASRYPFFRS